MPTEREDPNNSLGSDIFVEGAAHRYRIGRDKAYLGKGASVNDRPLGPLRTNRGYDIEQEMLHQNTTDRLAEAFALLVEVPHKDPAFMQAVVDAMRSVIATQNAGPIEPDHFMPAERENWRTNIIAILMTKVPDSPQETTERELSELSDEDLSTIHRRLFTENTADRAKEGSEG